MLSKYAGMIASGGHAFTRVSDAHHVPTRGAGGKDGDTVPLCRAHHQEWHSIGEAEFDKRHGLNLRAVAQAIGEAMQG